MAIDKIQSESINLADNFDFTGSVTGAGESNKPYFEAYVNSNFQVSQNTTTVVQFGAENFDSASAFDTSNYRFTPQTAGKYFFYTKLYVNLAGGNITLNIRKNGTAFVIADETNSSRDSADYGFYQLVGIIDANGSSDYFDVTWYQNTGTKNVYNSNKSYFGGFLISTT